MFYLQLYAHLIEINNFVCLIFLKETEQLEDKKLRLQVEIQGLRQQKTDLQQMLAQHKCAVNIKNECFEPMSNLVTTVNLNTTDLNPNEISESNTTMLSNNLLTTKKNPLQQQNISSHVKTENVGIDVGDIFIKCEESSIMQPDVDNKDNMDIIPTTVLQQTQRRRPTTLLQLNNSNFGNNKKVSGNDTGVVVLNFDSLMDGGTGLTPVSTNGGNVQSHHQQAQRGSVNTSNNGVIS